MAVKMCTHIILSDQVDPVIDWIQAMNDLMYYGIPEDRALAEIISHRLISFDNWENDDYLYGLGIDSPITVIYVDYTSVFLNRHIPWDTTLSPMRYELMGGSICSIIPVKIDDKDHPYDVNVETAPELISYINFLTNMMRLYGDDQPINVMFKNDKAYERCKHRIVKGDVSIDGTNIIIHG